MGDEARAPDRTAAESPFSFALPPAYDAALADVRAQYEALVGREDVQKSSAVDMLRLLHAMETMVLQIASDRNREVMRLQNELALSQTALRNANMLDSLTADVDRVRAAVERCDAEIRDVREATQSLSSSVRDMQSATALAPRRR